MVGYESHVFGYNIHTSSLLHILLTYLFIVKLSMVEYVSPLWEPIVQYGCLVHGVYLIRERI
jgi:hypothetical protein